MELKPFIDYYMNCYLNNLFSILITIDESYRLYAYENNYSYNIIHAENSDSSCFLLFEYLLEIYLKTYNTIFGKNITISNINDFLHYNIQPLGIEYSLNTSDNFLYDINQLLNDGYIFFMGVDLYFLIPQSPLYYKTHKNHYTIISSYEKNTYAVFDEGPFGYNKHHINDCQLTAAINNSTMNPKCFFFKIPKTVSPYIIDMNKIYNNAQRIIKEIKLIDYDWFYRSKNNLIQYIENINKIVCRQQGNCLLFQYLFEKSLIKKTIANELIDDAKQLGHKWAIIKNYTIKINILNRIIENKKFKEDMISLLKEEISLWEKFLL